MSAPTYQLIKFKRWRLHEGRREQELLELVRREIAPQYRKLPGCLRLGLLRATGTRSYPAVQYLESREVYDRTIGSASFKAW
jgi:hypothetical protein